MNVCSVWFILVAALAAPRAKAFVLLPCSTDSQHAASASRSSSTTTTSALFGVLSRSAILSAVNRQRNQPTNKRSLSDPQPPLTKWFLAGAIQEARHRQRHVLDALERESAVVTTANTTMDDAKDDAAGHEKLQQKAERRKRVTHERSKEIQACLSRLQELENELKNQANLDATKEALVNMGFHKLLADPDSWKWNTARYDDTRKGSPADFGGLVYTTPLGVPILVGKQSSHGDSTLRRISQGADIWFQVSDYHGSRVLLRTSLAKGLKDSKECRIMAANLAAYYSDYRKTDIHDEAVPVMYTDSKHVAKRGSKAGQMRKKKAFGEMRGRPSEVAAITKGQEP